MITSIGTRRLPLSPISLSLAALFSLLICGGAPAEQRTLHLPEKPDPYVERLQHPALAEMVAMDTTPEDNPLSNAGARLGRALFYDVGLSANHQVSCGSCHVQQHAFSDPRPVSVGFAGQSTDRKSMRLTDLTHVRARFFWDERADTLEEAVLQPLYSHVEMGLDPETLVERLETDPNYAPLFEAAFGGTEVTPNRVARALAQFLRAMVSVDSKFDRAAVEAESITTDFPGFTPSENRGKEFFFSHCASCHTVGDRQPGMAFAMFRSLNNGIDPNSDVRDGGRGDITMDPSEVGLFKAGSLRNVEYGGPYMHDGRLATLEDVARHYSEQITRHPTVGPVKRLQLSAEDQTALVDFLKTLTDHRLISDPMFSDPWIPVRPLPSQTTKIPTSRPELAGMSSKQTHDWLRKLDTNEDSTVSPDEWNPLVEMLVETRFPLNRLRIAAPNGGGRREGRRPGTAEPTPSVEEADFNGDDVVDPTEAAQWRAIQRLIELEDGGRLEVILDRTLSGMNLPAADVAEFRRELRHDLHQRNRFIQERNTQLKRDLTRILGEPIMERLQVEIVDAQVTSGGDETSMEILRTQYDQRVREALDTNGDGILDPQEIEAASILLGSAPGGFGHPAPRPINVESFAERILRHAVTDPRSVTNDELPERMRPFFEGADTDGDGKLIPEEARAHVKRVAFARLMETGIYVGSGFANLWLHYADNVERAAPDDETRAQVVKRLERQRAELTANQQLILQRQQARLREILRKRPARTATRDAR